MAGGTTGGAGQGDTRFEALLARPWPGAGGLAQGFAAASRAAREAVPAADPRAAAIRDVAAGVAAPMLASYVLWVLLDARARGLERLHFLARDGQVLHELAAALAPRLGVPVECRYLYASRQAWVRDLAPLPPEGQGWLWYGARPGAVTAGDILARLGGDPALAAALAGFSPLDRPLDAGGMARLGAALASEPFAATRAPLRAAARARLLAYLGQEGVLDGKPFGVVDLGWRGSLHASLCDLLAEEGLPPAHGYLLGVEAGGSAAWAHLRQGYLFDLDREAGGLFAPIADQRAYLEVFAAADHGTLLGYRDEGGRIRPELACGFAARVRAWGLPTMRASLRAAAAALPLDGVDEGRVAAMRAPIRALLAAFWTAPTPVEARAWGGFPLDLGEGRGSRAAPLAAPFGPRDLARLLGRRAGLKKDEHFWVEGALAMSPGPLRAALVAARAARSRLARGRGRR
jgi:hypothetical protein